MNKTGFVQNVDEGIKNILESDSESPFVLLEDTARAKLLVSTNCNLNILDVKSMGIKSYGFVVSRENFFLKEIFSRALIEMNSNGVLEELKNKWWKPCQLNKIEDSIGLNNTGGMFILLAIGVLTVIFIQVIQIFSRKKQDISWKKK